MPTDIRSFFSPPAPCVDKHNVSSPDIQLATKRKRLIIESSPETTPVKKKAATGRESPEQQQKKNGSAEQHLNGNNETSAGGGGKDSNNGERAAPLSVQEKEQRLVELRQLMPQVNDLQAQEVLVRADWIVEKARKTLLETSSSSSNSENDKSLNSSGEIFENVEEYNKSKKRDENGSSSSSSRHHHHKSSSSSSSSHRHKHHKSSRSSSSSGGHRSSSDNNKTPTKQSSSSSSHHHKSSSSSSNSHKSPSKSSSSSSHHHHSPSSKDKEKRRSDEHKKDHHHSKSHKSSHRDHHHHSSSSSSSKSKSHSSSSSSRDKDKDKSSPTKSAEKRDKKPALVLSSDDEDHGNRQVPDVYDSDASSDDGESNAVLAKSRQVVLDFLNEASQSQLTAIKTCSVKKADAIIELRPFDSWRKLVESVSNSKQLSTDLLNNCQELLNRRQKMTVLLKKCKKIISRLEQAIEENKNGAAEQPKLLSSAMKLADYQLIGLNWLIMMHREGFNGILADEMGLGKTIQVIAFLTYLKEHKLSSAPNVVVVPSSTLDNWDNEMAKWSPELVVAKYYGSQDERRALRQSFNKGGLDGVDVILTTYHTVASQPEERKMFRTIKTDYVIFDEAHMLKNMTTQRYEQLVKINAQRRLLLTGTPLQNNLMELMSLLCFVMPKLFSGSVEDLKTLFQKGGKQQKTTEVTQDGEPVTSFEQSQIEQAKMVMKPFVLRRLKKDVLQCLPPKSSTVVNVKMMPEQAQRYADLVEGYKQSRAEGGDDETSGMTVMMDMRKLTNHPLLLRQYFTDAKLREIAKRLATDLEYKKENADYIFEELAIMSDFQVYQLAQKYTSTKNYKIPRDMIMDCGKFLELDKLLPKLKMEGHRVLIFSQFTMMLDILEKYLEYKNMGFMRLDGQTNVTDRQDMIDDFNSSPEDYFVFLLSTRAGGLGINLTSADTVIIYDIDFNPYNDKQAEDRCHRLGQTKPVHIYKMITENSIEEGMYAAAQEKLNLERDVTNVNEGGQDDNESKCMVKLLSSALGIKAGSKKK